MSLEKVLIFFIIFVFLGCNYFDHQTMNASLIEPNLENKMQLYLYYKEDDAFEFSLPTPFEILRDNETYDYLVIINTNVLIQNKELLKEVTSTKIKEITMIDNYLDAIFLGDFIVNKEIIYSFGMGYDSSIVWINNKLYEVDQFNVFVKMKEKFIPWNYYNSNNL